MGKFLKSVTKFFLNDKIILALILINALVIFAGGFSISAFWESNLELLDNTITILFIIELLVKLRNFGAKAYFSDYWNLFDFLLIILSIPPLISSFLGLNSSALSFILIFRVLRVFKSFRFIKFMPGMDRIVAGLKRALKASLVIIFTFLIYIFIIGILSFNLFKEIAPLYFGNPIKSMYTTFKIFTIEGWYEIPETITANLSAEHSFLVTCYFIIILLSGGILGMSLVNSIFVDAMVSDNNDDLEKKVESLEHKIDILIKNSTQNGLKN
ncbi:ion transporter [Ornithobacterium rhinotracheale]|uniref:ion transporter n=1 Tax=Ornithobacterium rhinotracheale TaxID=28251 RepID=UPI004035EF93